jgi:hypothetical protein
MINSGVCPALKLSDFCSVKVKIRAAAGHLRSMAITQLESGAKWPCELSPDS